MVKLRVTEIDGGDDLMAEENLTQGIASVGLAQRNEIAAERLGDMEGLAAIAEPALVLNFAELVLGRIV